MITLVEVKEYLNIDFDDYDSMLQTMLDASIDRAETITGIDEDNFNSEIKLAVMKDVAFAFENRGSNSQINTDTLATYRRNSLRPIF
jgi:uncharacterized phage protein (predicted DNA packaging)